MKKREVTTHWTLFAGVLIGVLIGIAAINFNCVQFVKDWISPIGEIFVKILSLIAVPLLFVSIINAIISMKSTANLVSLGWRSILMYSATTLLATVFAIGIALIVQPGKFVNEQTSENYFGMFTDKTTNTIETANSISGNSPLDFIVDMVPDNIINPLTNSSNMLQALILAILVGVCIVTIKGKQLSSIRNLILDLEALLSHAIELTMYIVPVGIMALMADVVVSCNGDIQLLKAMGVYSLTTTICLIAFAYIVYPIIIKLFTNINVRKFISAIIPVQLMAISTSSSAATLPTTMKVANQDLGINNKITSFTLPMGVTINMDGSSIYLSITVIFIAQVLNIDLSFAQIMFLALTSMIASVGTPGVPGGVLVTIVMVLSAMGIPLESMALVIALVRPIDMFVTALNVTGDIAVSAVLAHKTSDEQINKN